MDVLTEARDLAQRYAKGDAFRRYVRDRAALVLPTLALFFAISVALGLGLFGAMGTHHFGVLLAMVLLPFVLFGSFALQAFVFFAWLELRALAPLLPPGTGLRLRLGKPPPIPWIACAVLVLVPFLVLVLASLKAAALVLVVALLIPLAYTLLEPRFQ
ncbi:MAG TPA: hypothetical protein VE085_02150 [Burkholderiales bacterium]|nr:hypothetical protein [Burkholderiales bacterium]